MLKTSVFNRHQEPMVTTALRYLIIIVVLLIIGIPILYGILNAFKSNREILLSRFFPSKVEFGNFAKVLSDARVLRGIGNSLLICGFSVVIGCLLSITASVPIGRRKEKIFKIIYLLFISSMIIPPISSFVTLYYIMVKMRLVNNMPAIIMLFSAQFMLPIGVLIFSSFIKTIPFELEEAAKLEGCGFFRRMFIIISPLIKAPILTLTVLQLPQMWNEFLLPLLFLRKQEYRTLTLLIYNYTRDHESDYGAIFALIVIGMTLPLILFIIARKKIEESIGATAGGVKG